MSPKTISRKFIMTILSAAIATTALSARPAHALDGEDAVKLLFGATALFMIGKAIEDRNDKPAPVTRHHHYHPKPKPQPHAHKPKPKPHAHKPKPRPLPQRARVGYKNHVPQACVRDFAARGGTVRMLGAYCVNKRYPQAHKLPNYCKTRIHTRNRGVVKGFDPQCLRQNGFRTSYKY